jgi:hypothetical protein
MQSIEAPLNGMNLYAPRHCRTTVNHGQTPLEAEWMIEVSDAVIEQGFDREAGNDLLGLIAARFENQKPAEGYDIGECYDLVRHQPKEAYRQSYNRVKAELRKMGLTRLEI